MAESARDRQRKVSQRREESGLKTKKCHFSEYTSLGIDEISSILGYSDKELVSNENFSYILDYCVSVTLNVLEQESLEGIPKNKEAQYLYKLKQIAKFRTEQGDSPEDIVEHMLKWQYETPFTSKRASGGGFVCKQARAWSESLVERILDEKKFNNQIKHLNTYFER
ncbi:hypothetical protein BJG01_09865 [Vibrio splendidus]|nr:hypothetical protein BJG01_09865 [Vibrio splendidus]URM14686.1 hypothetical protein KLJ63_03605 [Vibrio splendidus]